MYKMILVALALDQGHGPRALELARQLKSDGGAIVALHVIDEVPGFASYYVPADHEDEVRASAKEKLAERVGDKKDAKDRSSSRPSRADNCRICGKCRGRLHHYRIP